MRSNSILGAAVLGAGLIAGGIAAHAKDPAAPGPVVATITITARSAAVGVGYSWGKGELHYKGHTYEFSVNGVSVAAVGYAKVVGHGRVYGMKRLTDFTGTYVAATGEATLVKGIGGQFLQNANGVQIRIDNVTRGANLAGAANGIQFRLLN